MTRIKGIIANHRAKMEAAGLLRRVEAGKLSQKTAAMRPSLAKVHAALHERPDRFAVVQPSPMAILFEITLPRIEDVLAGMEEVRVEQIVSSLCGHGKAMIEKYGIEGSKKHLEGLFKDLPGYEGKLKEDGGVEEVIEAYRGLDFEKYHLIDRGLLDFDLKNVFIKSFGKLKAQPLLLKLYEHGLEMIKEHGIQRAKEHLDRLHRDLVSDKYKERLRQDLEIEEIIEAYRRLEFENLDLEDRGVRSFDLRQRLKDFPEEAAFQIMLGLYWYGLGVIKAREVSGTKDRLDSYKRKKHLENLYRDLPDYVEPRRFEENDVSRIIVAHQKLDFQEDEKGYLELMLRDKIESLQEDMGGGILLKLKNSVRDLDLLCLQRLPLAIKFLIIESAPWVSDAGLAHLKDINLLQVLVLTRAQITDAGLENLKDLKLLAHLNLARTQISDLSPLSGLVNLDELDLAQTEISDLTPLSRLTRLRKLRLWGCTQLSDITPLKNLTGLRELHLGVTKALSNNTQLEALKKAIPELVIYS